jgi:hypothetical protein
MEQTSDRQLSLRELMLRLREEHGLDPSYHAIWARIANGTIPAVRGPGRGGAWLVPEADLPRIADLLRKRAAA